MATATGQNAIDVEDVKICSLASGSNGNAYYIEADGKAILIDIGISWKKLKNRAMTRHIDLRKVCGVFISHEHSDHVYGLAGTCHHLDVRAYMSRGTWEGMREKYRPERSQTEIFAIGTPVTVGPFTVHSFAKPHDVVEPCSFRVEANGVSVGVFTDIGRTCEGLEENLGKCHVAFMESNYDTDLLRNGHYAEQLKRRIVSGLGHLSNVEAAAIVERVAPSALHTLFLSHVSEDNNRPDIALQAFDSLKDKYRIKVMSRYEASDIWRINKTDATCEPVVPVIPDRLDRQAVQLDFNFG